MRPGAPGFGGVRRRTSPPRGHAFFDPTRTTWSLMESWANLPLESGIIQHSLNGMATNLPDFCSINRQWEALAKICLDGGSQGRLNALLDQLNRWPASQATSAQAEIETAYFLVQAGFSLAFLEAACGRTADVECYEGVHRFLWR